MAALGNKNAVGNDGGRPRKHDRKDLQEKLITWSKLLYSTNLNAFCRDHGLSPQYIFSWSAEDPEFREAVNIAKGNIATNREELLCRGAFNPVAYSLNLRTYDKFNYEQWKEEKIFESELKSKAEKESNKDLVINVIQKPWKDE